MNLKKVTDFITLEDGNIGRKAAMVTGALLTSTVLGAVLVSEVQAEYCHDHACFHVDYWYSTCNGACNMHHNDYCGEHYNSPTGTC
jgi:hypothetical protein